MPTLRRVEDQAAGDLGVIEARMAEAQGEVGRAFLAWILGHDAWVPAFSSVVQSDCVVAPACRGGFFQRSCAVPERRSVLRLVAAA
jgi:hypothetical protein